MILELLALAAIGCLCAWLGLWPSSKSEQVRAWMAGISRTYRRSWWVPRGSSRTFGNGF